jgi:hypothetical protein
MSGKDKKKSFRELINEDRSDDPLTEEEAMFALPNLSEFIWLLYEINEREKIIPLDVLSGKKPMPETEPMKEAVSIKRGWRKKRKQQKLSTIDGTLTGLEPIKMS